MIREDDMDPRLAFALFFDIGRAWRPRVAELQDLLPLGAALAAIGVRSVADIVACVTQLVDDDLLGPWLGF